MAHKKAANKPAKVTEAEVETDAEAAYWAKNHNEEKALEYAAANTPKGTAVAEEVKSEPETDG